LLSGKGNYYKKRGGIVQTDGNSCRLVIWAYILVIIVTFCLMAGRAKADDAEDSAQLVDKARMTLENFIKAPEMENFRSILKNARGVLIAPQVLKGAIIIGASGGSGVFVVRDGTTGNWVGPAFYTIGGVSFGFQAGAQASEVVLLAMTDRGVTALLNSSVKLGADVGIAAGPIGVGAAASTANLSADIVSFSRAQGLFGGIALDGAVVKVRNGLNSAYYHKNDVSPTDILIRKTVTNPGTESLTAAVQMAAEH
jgi:SH3 domain-containing YSC84-like protein 1